MLASRLKMASRVRGDLPLSTDNPWGASEQKDCKDDHASDEHIMEQLVLIDAVDSSLMRLRLASVWTQ